MPHLSTPSLAEVEAQFVDWRRHRIHSQTPESLKIQALALLEAHSIREVCRTLRLNYDTLKRWRQQQRPEARAGDGFVALEPVSLPTTTTPRVALTLTHQARDGGSLSISGELSQTDWAWAWELLRQVDS